MGISNSGSTGFVVLVGLTVFVCSVELTGFVVVDLSLLEEVVVVLIGLVVLFSSSKFPVGLVLSGFESG